MNLIARIASLLVIVFTCVNASAQEPTLVEPAEVKIDWINVNVLGSVKKPSRYVLPVTATVMDALASAGDATRSGNLSKVKLIRKTAANKPDITIIDVKQILKGSSKDAVLRDGDTLFVPESVF